MEVLQIYFEEGMVVTEFLVGTKKRTKTFSHVCTLAATCGWCSYLEPVLYGGL